MRCISPFFMPTVMTIMIMTTVMSWKVFYLTLCTSIFSLFVCFLFGSFSSQWVGQWPGILERSELSRRNRFRIGWYIFPIIQTSFGRLSLNPLCFYWLNIILGRWCLCFDVGTETEYPFPHLVAVCTLVIVCNKGHRLAASSH